EGFGVAVGQEGGVRQFTGGLARVDGQGGDAAVHVHGGVAAGGAGAGAEFGELLHVAAQVLGEVLEDRGALSEGEGAQGWAADLAGVGEHRARVGAGGGQERHRLPGGGVRQGPYRAGAVLPGALRVAAQYWRHRFLRSRKAVMRVRLSSPSKRRACAARSKVVVDGHALRSASLVSSKARQARLAMVSASARPRSCRCSAAGTISSTRPVASASDASRRAPA